MSSPTLDLYPLHIYINVITCHLLLLPQQPSGFGSTLSDLKVALQDLNAELREERQSSQELTQQFARAKASWEVEWMELKSIITQVTVCGLVNGTLRIVMSHPN